MSLTPGSPSQPIQVPMGPLGPVGWDPDDHVWTPVVPPAARAAGIAQVGFTGTVALPNTTWTPMSAWALGATIVGGIATQDAAGFHILIAGWYDITSTIQIAANATGNQRLAGIFLNGTVFSARATQIGPISAAAGAIGQVNTYVRCNVGDVITAGAFQDSGGSLNLLQAFLELNFSGS